jgi:hypothetical protein
MHQKQLTEHYYEILNEASFGGFLSGARRVGGRFIRGAGRAAGTGIGLAGSAIDALSPLLPYAAAGAGAYYGADLLKGLLGAVQPVSGQGGSNRNFNNRRNVDANVARSLASGDKEDYYDYLADLQNSDMSGNARTGSIIRTRALASNMAKNRAAQMKAFALSGKNEKGAAYLKAKAEYEAARKADPDIDDASKDLSGTRPDGTSFTIKGKRMSDKAKAAYEKMQQARKDALGQEYTVGDLEGKRPSNAAANAGTPSNSGNPPRTPETSDLDSPEDYEEWDKEEERRKEREEHKKGEREAWTESFKNYYNILKEQDTGGGIGQVPGAAEGKPRVDEINKEAEEKRKAEEKAKKEEEDAKKAAEEAENARLNTKVGSWSDQIAIANSLEQGPMNLQPVERTRGGFSVGRGFGGKPIITGGSYKNPNSPEARVMADVQSGKLPASFGQYQGNRLPMDLEAEQKAAGQQAFDKEVGFSTVGMSRDQIKAEMLKRQKEKTAQELESKRNEIDQDVKGFLRGLEVKKSITPIKPKPPTSKPQDKPILGVPELLSPNPPTIDQPEWRVDQQPGPNTSKFPKSPDYPTPETTEERNARLRRGAAARGLKPDDYPKSPDYPTPATSQEMIARAAEDIRTRNTRTQLRRKAIRDAAASRGLKPEDYPKSPDYPRPEDREAQRKRVSDDNIRGAGYELRKNIGTIFNRLGFK